MLIDTHCHIHGADYPFTINDVLERALANGVEKMICVGTSQKSSEEAIKAAAQYDQLFAAVGVHPHDATDGCAGIAELASKKAIAIGEIGLDYYYENSPKDTQIKVLEEQIQIALDNDLPIIFHVRNAFDDFWRVLDNYETAGQKIRGLVHSFTDSQANLEEAIRRGLFIGVNGISTFTKDTAQQQMFANIPLEKMVLETDAPFLAPANHRGAINEPARIRDIAEFHAKLRGVSVDEVGAKTTENAEVLFDLHIYKEPSLY